MLIKTDLTTRYDPSEPQRASEISQAPSVRRKYVHIITIHVIAFLFVLEPQRIQNAAPLLGSETGKEFAEGFYSLPGIFVREL
jgi:hypothetical protein